MLNVVRLVCLLVPEELLTMHIYLREGMSYCKTKWLYNLNLIYLFVYNESLMRYEDFVPHQVSE